LILVDGFALLNAAGKDLFGASGNYGWLGRS
jgi:hypothetical protein